MKRRSAPAGVVAAAAWLAGCASAAGPALPGETTAREQLERDTLATLMGMDRGEDARCGQRRLANRDVIEAEAAKAVKHWFIDRCETRGR